MNCEYLNNFIEKTWENFKCNLPPGQDCPHIDDMKVKCEIKKVMKELANEYI
jgi:hypothetical protein